MPGSGGRISPCNDGGMYGVVSIGLVFAALDPADRRRGGAPTSVGQAPLPSRIGGGEAANWLMIGNMVMMLFQSAQGGGR